MAKAIAFPVMVLAALGVLVSFLLYVASFANPDIAKIAVPVVFPGIFVVWLPTVLLMNRLTRDFKQRDIWKSALRGCPAWMRTTLWVVAGFAVIAAFVPALLGGGKTQGFPDGFLIFPAAFYSMSFCVMYSVLHVEKSDAEHRCLNGHRISPLAKFCEECGAPAAPEGTQAPNGM